MVEKTGLSNIPNSHLPSASLVGQFEDTHKKESMAGYMEDNLDMPLGMLLPIMQDSIINRTTYFGVRTWKGPIDAWLYQEIIFETKPDVIVENSAESLATGADDQLERALDVVKSLYGQPFASLEDAIALEHGLGKLESLAPLAQWQSSGLLIHWLTVRVRRGAPCFDLRFRVKRGFERFTSGDCSNLCSNCT